MAQPRLSQDDWRYFGLGDGVVGAALLHCVYVCASEGSPIWGMYLVVSYEN